MKKLLYFALICLSFTFISCASVDVARMKTVSPKPESCKVDVYTEISSIKRSYEVVCILASTTGSTLFADKSIQKAIDNAKPEACKCGADAILIESVDKKGMTFNDYGHGSANIKAIVYTDSN